MSGQQPRRWGTSADPDPDTDWLTQPIDIDVAGTGAFGPVTTFASGEADPPAGPLAPGSNVR
jgi:hypothetical protein